jgi:dTDP-4-dehydrorhamnose reductase
VLVTGARGQLALSLTGIARRPGEEIIALGRPRLDIRDGTSMAAALARTPPSVVVNAAAYTNVDAAEREAEIAHAINAEGAGTVAAACERLGIPLIHISTDYVFDGLKGGPYVEADAAGPLNAYGRSKLAGEQRVVRSCRRHVILRTSWLYSPFATNFARTMLSLAQARADIDVVRDQVGSPTYARHLAEAVLAIARRVAKAGRDDAPWGTYHAAGGGNTSWCGLAQEIFRWSEALGGPHARVHPISTAACTGAARRPANSQLDCTALGRVFGIALPEWQVGTRACVERLRAAGWPGSRP